jgi:hypothetical protein
MGYVAVVALYSLNAMGSAAKNDYTYKSRRCRWEVVGDDGNTSRSDVVELRLATESLSTVTLKMAPYILLGRPA